MIERPPDLRARRPRSAAASERATDASEDDERAPRPRHASGEAREAPSEDRAERRDADEGERRAEAEERPG